MASDYPGGLDSFDTIASDKKTSDAVGGRTHRAMHNDLGDAIEAVQTELGTNPSGSESTVVARLDKIEDGTRLGTNSVGATQIAANAVGASELADNAVDTAAVADSAITTAKVADGAVTAAKMQRQVGNLLSENQAAVSSTGLFALDGCTEGAAGVFTATGSGAMSAYTSTAVSPGETVTAVSTLAPVGRAALVLVEFLTAGGANVGGYPSGNSIPAGDTGTSSVTAVAPATAAAVRLYSAYTGSGSGGDAVTLTRAGLWRGAGGQWAMPSVPIAHTGIRPNPSNTAEVQIWNDATATWITV